MKKIIYFLTIAIIQLSCYNLYSKSDIQIETNIRNGGEPNIQGRDFLVAFPLNDNANKPQQNIAIFVTSSVNTTVRIYNPYIGLDITKEVKAYEITEFSSAKGGLGWDAEIRDFEKVLDQGFHIMSEHPISVYCLNSKSFTSEGYMAIPTEHWGTDYIHNSFYDFKEQQAVDWGGGFTVIAKEDFTQVKISLVDGKNKVKGLGQTTGGREHGSSWTVNLMAGQTYTVQGDGKTRGIFDISGSNITSDKPIGLISYHNRCMIPATIVTSGRDHLIEMLPPINTWGNEYFSLELDRGSDKGDYFRVLAGEDKTTFNISWYDKDTKELISSFGPIVLKEKGDWFEYNGSGAIDPHELESIRGIAKFTSDKPMLVVQYSYSGNYDSSPAYDPFMIVLPPTNQYVKSSIFMTPSNSSGNDFRDNYIRIIALGDPTDKRNNEDLLGSITLNGKEVMNMDANFVTNNIPGTNYYWAQLGEVNQGTHNMQGITPFSANIYGFANFNSYAWPATAYWADNKVTDTLSPNIGSIGDECSFIFKVIDNPDGERNGSKGDLPKQVDSGVEIKPTLKSGSFNFNEPNRVSEDGSLLNWPSGVVLFDFNIGLTIIDPNKDAMGIVEVTDKAGNTTEVTIFYEADKVNVEIDYTQKILQTRVNNETNSLIGVENKSNYPITVHDVSVKDNTNFTLEKLEEPVTLDIDSKLELEIFYKPTKEYTDFEGGLEKATVETDLGCVKWDSEIEGQGYIPKVEITNMIFDTTEIKNGISKQKGRITISNVSEKIATNRPPLYINGLEVDDSAPNSDLFSNFTIVQGGVDIADFVSYQLLQGDSLNIEFDFNTNSESTGDKIARLIVKNFSGPADINDPLKPTINQYNIEFDGKYTTNNQTGLDDGGYIVATLIDPIQSSVEDTEINEKLKVNIVSANPMNNDLLKLSLSNEEQSIVSVNITDLEGKVLMKLMDEYVGSEAIVKEFNISELKSGTYFISATDGTNQTTTKFIIAE